MAKVNSNDIIAYRRNNKLYCIKCAEDEKLEDIQFEELVMREELESDECLENYLFCDICKTQIEW